MDTAAAPAGSATARSSTTGAPAHHMVPLPPAQHPSRRSALRLLAAGAAAVAAGAAVTTGWTSQSAAAATASRQLRLTLGAGGRTLRGGVPYRAAGVNLFQLALNDYPSPHIPKPAAVEAMLDAAQGVGADLVRSHTLGISVGPASGTLVKGVSGTTRPVIEYDDAAWDAIDRVVASAARRGTYLVVPLVDELGYFHGGKRNWVAFRRPGSVSLDWQTTSANSRAQRDAESAFYTDPQVVADFRQYVTDWLTHVNRYTGRANADEPAIAVVETGNEMWSAPQDGPGWTESTAALIKSLAPRVLVADGSAADGVAVELMAWDCPDVDVLGTHPYGWRFGADAVRSQAAFAASKGKAYLVGEYPWSAQAAPDIELAARAQPNLLASAPWSLQLDDDLHSNGAAYGSADVSLYVPGKDAVQRGAVARLQSHARALAIGTTAFDDFTTTTTTTVRPSPERWTTTATTGGSATVDGGTLVLRTGSGGQWRDVVVAGSAAPPASDRTVSLVVVAETTGEAYLRVALRARRRGVVHDTGRRYFLEVAGWGGFSVQRSDDAGVRTVLGQGTPIPGFGAGVPVSIELSVRGTRLEARCWTGEQRPADPSWSGTDLVLRGPGSTGVVLNGGEAGEPRTWRVQSWSIS